jgi:hypothetical protein
MIENEQKVKMAARLYDMRDKARWLLGDRYEPHMAELGKILKMTAERDNKDVLAVAIEIAQKRALTGMDLMMVMSAAVELAEPSTPSSAARMTATPTAQADKGVA